LKKAPTNTQHGLKSSGRKVLTETSLLFNYFCGGG